MTNKQIIDGKECKYWFKLNPSDYRKCSLRGKNDNCDEIKDCFVKELLGKLALKEQECERLTSSLLEIEEIARNMNTSCFYDDFDCKDCDMKNGCIFLGKLKILQKISECEGNNDMENN